jgi:hypothetical protein
MGEKEQCFLIVEFQFSECRRNNKTTTVMLLARLVDGN